MSTRAQVRFATRESGQSFNQHAGAIHAQFYVHHDGYPEGLGIQIAESLISYQKINNWERCVFVGTPLELINKYEYNDR